VEQQTTNTNEIGEQKLLPNLMLTVQVVLTFQKDFLAIFP